MNLLEVRDLHTSFFTDAGEVKAVNGISFDLDRGKVLGIVGESGSGKSVTAYSIMQILASTGKIVSGSIKFDGIELVGAGEKVMKDIRGNRISIIFQDPMTSLNPTYSIGKQLMDKAKEVAARQQRRAVMLETQSCNTNAIGFYLHEGFELIGFDTCCYTNDDIGKKEVRLNLGYFFHKEPHRR